MPISAQFCEHKSRTRHLPRRWPTSTPISHAYNSTATSPESSPTSTHLSRVRHENKTFEKSNCTGSIACRSRFDQLKSKCKSQANSPVDGKNVSNHYSHRLGSRTKKDRHPPQRAGLHLQLQHLHKPRKNPRYRRRQDMERGSRRPSGRRRRDPGGVTHNWIFLPD